MAKGTAVYPEGGESVLHDMFNLICPAGHRAFSPEPMGFVGTQCMSQKAKDGSARCNKRLAFLSDSRAVPEPKPKRSKKLKKMRRY